MKNNECPTCHGVLFDNPLSCPYCHADLRGDTTEPVPQTEEYISPGQVSRPHPQPEQTAIRPDDPLRSEIVMAHARIDTVSKPAQKWIYLFSFGIPLFCIWRGFYSLAIICPIIGIISGIYFRMKGTYERRSFGTDILMISIFILVAALLRVSLMGMVLLGVVVFFIYCYIIANRTEPENTN